MTFSSLTSMFKESKEKINQFAELQKVLYDINVDKISSTYHYILDNKIIQNDYDLLHLIQIIVYGCRIRSFQIAIYAHLCTLIHKSSTIPQFHNFRSILKEYLFKNLLTYNHMLLLYELMQDNFIDFSEINETFIEIYDTNPKKEIFKHILFFFAPELHSNSKELYNEIISDQKSTKNSMNDQSQLQFISKILTNTKISENDDFYRYCRLNGTSSQLFNAIAVDNVEFLSQNFNESMINSPIMKNSYFQRFEYLNHSPSCLTVASYFDSINCFKFILSKSDLNSDCLAAAAAGGATKIFSFLVFEKNVKISDVTVLTAIMYNQHQILEIINNSMKNEMINFDLAFQSITSFNLSCFLTSINSSEIFTQKNKNKQTILMMAAKLGIPELVNFIIQYYPCDIYHRDNKMRSLVYYAIKSSNLAVIQLILSLYKIDDPFLTRNEFFDHNSSRKTRKKLNSYVENSICQACKCGTSEIVDYLLNLTKSSINTCSFNNCSLLHFACQGSNIDVVCYLLSKKDIDINFKDGNGQTPLYFAIMNNSNKIVKLLLDDSRINIECTDNKMFISYDYL